MPKIICTHILYYAIMLVCVLIIFFPINMSQGIEMYMSSGVEKVLLKKNITFFLADSISLLNYCYFST